MWGCSSLLLKWRAVGLVFGATCVATMWQLWEQDIFWQIKAGHELLELGQFPTEDTWSFSAAHMPWRNHQWLSTVLIYFIHLVAGEPVGLILARSLLCGVLFALIWLRLGQGSAPQERPHMSLAILVMSLFFVILSERLQLRSELFVLLVFVGLLFSGLADFTKLGLHALVVQLHLGLSPFSAAVLIFGIGEGPLTWKRWSVRSAAAVGLMFVHPYPSFSLEYWWSHFQYASTRELGNPEHLSLLEMISQWSTRGLGPLLFVLLVATTLWWKWKLKTFPWREFTGIVILVSLSFLKSRAIPFAVLSLLPSLPPILKHWSGRMTLNERRLLPVVALSFFVLSLQFFPRPWGLDYNRYSFPVEAVEFLSKRISVGNPIRILHTPSTGNYLLSERINWPVFIDTREMMYPLVEKDYKSAFVTLGATTDLIDKYKINLFLLPIDTVVGGLASNQEVESRSKALLPASWDLVYFDNRYFVLSDAKLTHEHAWKSFKCLKPWISPIGNFERCSKAVLNDDLLLCRALAPTDQLCAHVELVQKTL